MVKASLFGMLVLTVLFAMGLRWREDRIATASRTPRGDILARGKRTLNRWVTAAFLATLATLITMAGCTGCGSPPAADPPGRRHR